MNKESLKKYQELHKALWKLHKNRIVNKKEYLKFLSILDKKFLR